MAFDQHLKIYVKCEICGILLVESAISRNSRDYLPIEITTPSCDCEEDSGGTLGPTLDNVGPED